MKARAVRINKIMLTYLQLLPQYNSLSAEVAQQLWQILMRLHSDLQLQNNSIQKYY